MKKKAIIFLGIVALFLISGILLFVIRHQSRRPTISPDYPPRETEENQKPLEGDVDSKLDASSGGGALNVTYSEDASVDLSEHRVELLYANPKVSRQNVAILIRIDDLVVARSGLITPGHGVEMLDLEPDAVDRLLVGGYDGEIVVSVYHPETGEKAMVDIVGQVTVTVRE